MKTLLTILALGLLCGCDPQRSTIETNSSGTHLVVTNGAAWRHSWQHQDQYYFISNTVPQ